MLPQKAEDVGYYTYGTPNNGRGQFAHQKMITFICFLQHEWRATDPRKIGLGNVSLANGVRFEPHSSHKSGLEIDIRPLRKDGKELPVIYTSPDYDRAATLRLVNLIWRSGVVKQVFFNDPTIPEVKPLANHNDHLHVTLKA